MDIIVKLISISVLLFSAIMDYRTRLVDTRVIYGGILVLIIIKAPSYWTDGTFWTYSLLLILTAVIFYIASILLEKHIGAGDFDVMLFLVVSLGYADFVKCLL